MRIHKPLNSIDYIKDPVFLAGPCPRSGQDWADWRSEMCDILEKHGFAGDVINPTNPDYDTNDPDYYGKQCWWETAGMNTSSCIVFWIDRNDEHPALTTNIEFGIWSDRNPAALVVGIPEGSEKCEYIKWVCETKGIKCFDTMEAVAEEVVSRFSRPQQLFFTSDTHFSSDRHIKMSQRPFLNVVDMDMTFISNWNKRVTSNDIVMHLGDFGNTDMLKKLNFGKLMLLKGNYERKTTDFHIDDDRVEICDTMSVDINGRYIACVHEPLCGISNDFYLYGHIHEKGKVKKNGFNVGIDANNYNLVSVDTVRFYMNAIEKHYDDNVFCDRCGNE